MDAGRIFEISNEILDRRFERDESGILGLLAQLACEAYEFGRSKKPKAQKSSSAREAAVADYRAGNGTLREISMRRGVPLTTLSKWVKRDTRRNVV